MGARLILHACFLGGLALALVAWGQVGTAKAVDIDVDGSTLHLQTRQAQVASVLREASITLGPADQVSPALDSVFSHDTVIKVQRATPVSFTYNSNTAAIQTAASSIRELVLQQGERIGPYDVVRVNGKRVNPTAALPSASGSDGSQPMRIDVFTARPIFVHDAGLVSEVHTTEHTIGGALNAAGYGVGPSDLILPSPASAVEAGVHVYLKRAKPITIRLAGANTPVETLGTTVEEALKAVGASLTAADEVSPPLGTPIKSGMNVSVVRLTERTITETSSIAYNTDYVADADMEYGNQTTTQSGITGQRSRQYRVFFRDGVETRRVLEKDTVEREPQQRVIHYGTKIIVRTLATEHGPMQYWRTMRVWATWYHPGSAGKPPGPGYGITSLGFEVHRGIIAVDPSVIPYYTEMYVPGYGKGIAADTGGGVRGSMIDLGYADDEEHDWSSRYVDIYFLGTGPTTITPPRG